MDNTDFQDEAVEMEKWEEQEKQSFFLVFIGPLQGLDVFWTHMLWHTVKKNFRWRDPNFWEVIKVGNKDFEVAHKVGPT